jgi:hypothetical protein
MLLLQESLMVIDRWAVFLFHLLVNPFLRLTQHELGSVILVQKSPR